MRTPLSSVWPMHAPPTRMTAAEYFEVSFEGDRMQLVDGVMVLNEPTPEHQLVCTRLLIALSNWANEAPERGLALMPIDVQMTELDVYGPDLVWFAPGRAKSVPELAGQIPDLVAEVRSPSTWRYDVGRKRSVYETGGVPELWLVDTKAEAVLVYRRSAPGVGRFDVALELTDTLNSPLLPGFSLDVKELFRLAL